jgi:N-acetylglutamate synthase-like GNAT family acetyltransferase
MQIRQATPADLSALVQLDTVAPEDPSRAEQIARWIAEGACQILEESGSAHAYAAVSRNFFHRPFIEMVMVGDQWRRRGCASALLRHLTLGVNEIWTSTNASNHPMQLVLEQSGFRHSGIVTGLDEGDPELIYRFHSSASS